MEVIKLSQQLPTSAYTDRAWFAAEQENLFGKVWNFVCFARDLAKLRARTAARLPRSRRWKCPSDTAMAKGLPLLARRR